jgi:glycine/D-amino acid oxidase-like deaminating enzyme
MSLTRKRDLRGGTSVWTAQRTPAVPATRLARSTRAEIVIVGGGISGALLAQSLAEAGKRPLILDRRRGPLLGSTAASTALLMSELDQPLVRMSGALGPRKARGIWLASREAVDELRTRTHRLGIRAHLENRPTLYLAGTVLDAKGLRREARARQRIGLSAEYLERRALRHHFGVDRAAALLSHGNAEAHPLELAAGFLREAQASGARLHAPHEVCGIECTPRGITLETRDGLEILARHVVFCTGYELPDIVPDVGTRIFSTWAIATRPQPAALWPQRALIWEASDPYLYLRTTADGRVLCGGEDAEFADPGRRDALLGQKTQRLERKLARLFPGVDARAALSWTGTFGSSRNGVPTIGAIPGYPRCHAVMGFGGNGITFSMLAARLITAAVLGRKLPESKLFGFR